MKTGILLCNVGTPDSTDVAAIRSYLREFMSDRRVIDRSGLWWKFLLNAVIIPRRAPKSAAAYRSIWNHDTDESPLRSFSRSQADQLQGMIGGTSERGAIQVGWAMRYGTPSIARSLGELVDQGCERLLIIPLYPQYSGATTGSMMDAVDTALPTLPRRPDLHVLPPHYDDPVYIDAVAMSIRNHNDSLGWAPERTLLSFHGLPQAFIERGDPYQSQCETTIELLRNALGLDEETMPLVYQSRGSRGEWIGPGLEESLVAMAGDGIRRVTVATPGFITDCVETLEEVALRAAQAFREAGGEEFSHVPCLNDSSLALEMIGSLAKRELGKISRIAV